LGKPGFEGPDQFTACWTPTARACRSDWWNKMIALGVKVVALSAQPEPATRRICSRKRAACGTLAPINAVNRRRMQILYSGQVQGVGFRYTVRSVAAGFEVTGSVRNLVSGAVELIAEGARDELEAFRQAIRESGLEHFIRQEEVSWHEASNEFRGFEIVR